MWQLHSLISHAYQSAMYWLCTTFTEIKHKTLASVLCLISVNMIKVSTRPGSGWLCLIFRLLNWSVAWGNTPANLQLSRIYSWLWLLNKRGLIFYLPGSLFRGGDSEDFRNNSAWILTFNLILPIFNVNLTILCAILVKKIREGVNFLSGKLRKIKLFSENNWSRIFKW